ncbi:DUF2256 domain-containing protein [Thalassospira profundimaris]|uniref:DUF2256 domain-containing protein n=1 Tax=Thalassospira profundimaris TaxID=502049 RepID=UPI000DED6591|nr:DUF2256 domain-containing protein [Thalassospira profundimaris]
MKKKADLPTKTCPVCQRSFAWRKKWKDCWPDVKYCSERCRRSKLSLMSRRNNTSERPHA